MLISAVYSVSGISSYFSCSETPKLEQITALNFSGLSKLARWKRMRDKVLLQLCCKGIKARPDVFWDLNISFKYFVCLKKNQSIATCFLSTLNYSGEKWISKVQRLLIHKLRC